MMLGIISYFESGVYKTVTKQFLHDPTLDDAKNKLPDKNVISVRKLDILNRCFSDMR